MASDPQGRGTGPLEAAERHEHEWQTWRGRATRWATDCRDCPRHQCCSFSRGQPRLPAPPSHHGMLRPLRISGERGRLERGTRICRREKRVGLVGNGIRSKREAQKSDGMGGRFGTTLAMRVPGTREGGIRAGKSHLDCATFVVASIRPSCSPPTSSLSHIVFCSRRVMHSMCVLFLFFLGQFYQGRRFR